MFRLFQRQVSQATRATGEVDFEALGRLVVAAYEEAERDRERTDRSIALMIEELDVAHQQLVDAFEAIPEGIALLDADDRYIMWNRRYDELYAATTFSPGVTFSEVLRAGLSLGQYADAIGREGEWLAERLARHQQAESTHEQHLAGDRWIRVEERRTAGGGSVGVRIDITDLKQREESFRLLFESNPIPMFVCHEKTLRILAANDAATQHYGFSRQQLDAMTVYDLHHPRDRDDARRLAQSGEGSHQNGDVRLHVKANGETIEVAIYSKRLNYGGIPATFFASIDVTERRKAARLLSLQKLQIDAALENMSQGLVMFDGHARMILCNRRFIELYGFSPEVVKPGCTLQTLLAHAKDRNLVSASEVEEQGRLTLQAARRGGSLTRTTEQLDGRTIYVSMQPMGDGGWVSTHEDTTEQRKARERIEYLAHHDELTGLPNRTAFNDYVNERLASSFANKRAFAVVCMDLDRFKEINDVFGHSVGDNVLRQVGERLREAAAREFLARIGGDEFVAVVDHGALPSAAEDLSSRLMAAVNQPYMVEGRQVRCGLSLGVAVYPSDGADLATLLANADAALYRAKREGRGAVRFFEAAMDQLLRTRRALQHDLEECLLRGELTLHYQPQARINGSIVGFEALARWTHPTQGSIPPGVFIPLAEEGGLIMELGELTLRQACLEAATWESSLRIAVNLSAVQFQHGDLPELVHRVLFETGLPADRLELEITESVLVADFERALGLLRRLKALGVSIAMDDFGTGYSSLSYLQAFPFDRIKIDRSFIARLGKNQPASAIVKAVIGLARGLALPVTAEGVETREQLEFLAAEACDEVQGYLIGRPRPIEDFSDVVRPGIHNRQLLVS